MTASYKISIFGPEDGVPSRSVEALEFDPDGRLWLGTTGGLAIFDGLRFQAIRSSETSGLGSDRILSIERGNRGELWIGTSGGPLSCYHGGKFREMAAENVLGDVRQILSSSTGEVWFAGRSLGRYAEGQMEVFTPKNEGLKHPIRRMALGADGAPWAASTSGLFHFQDDQLTQITERPISWVLADMDGRVWARERGTGQVFPVDEPASEYAVVPIRIITDELQLGRDKKVISTSNGLFSVSAPVEIGAPPIFTKIDFVSEGAFGALARGAEEDVWLGTGLSSLMYLERTISYPVPLVDGREMPGPSINRVRVLDGDRVIVRKPSGSASWIVKADGSSSMVLRGFKPLTGLEDACMDDQGRVVLGTTRGLFYLEGNEAIPIHGGEESIKALCRDDSGTLWSATGKMLTEVTTNTTSAPRTMGPFRSRVQGLIAVSNGLLSLNGGVIERADLDTLEVSTLREFPQTNLRHAFEDYRGDLWISTYGHGLYRLRGHELDHWDVEDGLPDPFLGWIGDPSGNGGRDGLWANSNSGAIRFDVSVLDQHTSGVADTIECTLHVGPEGNGADGAAFSNGLLALPTVDGLYFVDTATVTQHRVPPKVIVTSVEADGDPHSPSQTLFGSATLQFRYAAIVYPSAEDAVYRYRLNGYDKEWVDNGHERTVRFTDLPPGRYRFEVQARASDSPWSTPVEVAALTIHRNWYQRWDIRTLLLLAALGLMRLLYAWRTEAIRNKSQQLEEEVDHRRVLERALRASVHNHQTTLETAIDGIVTCETNGTICYVNPALEKMLGLERTAVEGKHVDSLGIEGLGPALKPFAHTSVVGRGERATTIRGEASRSDGSRLDVEATVGRAGTEESQRLVCVIRDIGERKRMMDSITRSERRFRGLFQTAPSAIFVWRRDHSVAEWNDCAGRLFGWNDHPPGEADLIHRFSPKTQNSPIEAALASALSGTAGENILCPTVTALGEVRSCRWYFAPIKDGQGDVETVLTLAIDVTDEERMARSMERLRRRIVKAEETERSRIARELHDDLSQRLAALSMDAQMIHQAPKAGGAPDREVPAAPAIQRVRDGLASLAVDVHSLSRRLHPTVVDDLGLARALRSECSRRSDGASAAIEFLDHSGGHDVPPETALALFRIAQEAIRNAQRHGLAKLIRVDLNSEGDSVSLEIIDDGEGFDLEALSEIPRHEREGGIGLVSMRERAHLVGGSLTVTSKIGEGTKILATAPFRAQPALDVRGHPLREFGQ